jgi:hypothetical protein
VQSSTQAAAIAAIGAEPAATINGINTQTVNYQLVITDSGQTIEMNVATANTVTIPPHSSVAFSYSPPARVDVVQIGAGQTSFVAGGGVTILSDTSKLKIGTRYGGASLYQRALDTWVLIGGLVP